MNRFYRYSLMALLVLGLVTMPFTNLVPRVYAASSPCIDTVNTVGAYTVHLCITSPGDASTLTTDGTVTATVSVTSGINPGVNQVNFFLNGDYLISTFHSPWTFTLPTNKFVDGVYTLAAEALMLDGFTTSQANISVTFTTGTATPPVVGNTFTPALGTTPGVGQPFVVAAVGDGADGGPSNLSVASLIASMNPNLFLYIGDVYDKGTLTEFTNWYGESTSFGQFKSITDPTVGSHEYLFDTVHDAGYQLYWDSSQEYYSFNTNGWHIISLNSNTHIVPGTPSSAQYLWLQTDLTNNTNPCTLVFYHHPYFSIGVEGTNHLMNPIWQLLADNKVTIVLNGNDHDYERWMPMDALGIPNPSGTTEFVVGTGGHAIQSTVSTDPRVVVSSSTNPLTYGALKLNLFSDHADYAFMSITGPTIDSGTVRCFSKTTPTLSTYLPLVFR